MIKKIFKVVILTLAVTVASQSAAFLSVNNQTVNQVNANEIEVLGKPGIRKKDFWCAVGDYLSRNKVSWRTKVYVKSGIGQGITASSNNAVVFTLNPKVSGVEIYTKNLVTDILAVGYGRSVTGAFDECRFLLLGFF
ncbi:hypothetical protein ACMAZE_06275 [Pseudopelagicola sp. nBUS_20]|mgnify:CR=1 FL=1|uniref:hypothetical protein n=1 Tax=Pseudopelagicola sp. nBUS_20 TaxID=3395317 RepID=UPI003EBF0474